MAFNFGSYFGWLTSAASRLLTASAGLEQSIHTVEADHPIVKMLVDEAVVEAQANGVPVGEIETAGKAILAVARATASASTPVAPAVAG